MAGERFAGIAYSGAVITHPWWGSLAIDVAGMRLQEKVPALREHARDRAAGVIDKHTRDAGKLRVEGYFLTSTADGQEVLTLARAGFPWRLSIAAWAESVEELKSGVSAAVNGFQLRGPAVIWRQTRIGEISFVSVPADERAVVDQVAASLGGPQKGGSMQVTFEGEVVRLVTGGMKRADAVRRLALSRPDLHEEMLRRHTKHYGPRGSGLGQTRFELAVAELEAEGMSKAQAIRKVRSERPGLHAEYLKAVHAAMGRGEIL
jgi:hypothetical protein